MPLAELKWPLTSNNRRTRPDIKAELWVGPPKAEAHEVPTSLVVLTVVEHQAIGCLGAERQEDVEVEVHVVHRRVADVRDGVLGEVWNQG